MTDQTIVAGVVFLAAYALIAAEWVHRTIIALLGAVVLILLGVIDQEHGFRAVDLNVIFLLLGMMVIANILAATGVFEWLAIRAVKIAKADPYRMLVALSLLTAVLSALLDNVTTVVLVAPMTFFVAARLRLPPTPFLIAQVLASNIGGTATLIGDPPNILIGSAAGLDFAAFLANLGPVSAISLALMLAVVRFTLARGMTVDPKLREEILASDEAGLIKNPRLLWQAGIVLGLTVIGFLSHQVTHYEPATVALAGALALLLWSKHDLHDALREVEWPTLLFFVGLFVMVEGVVAVGLVDAVARGALGLTGGNVASTSLLLLWLSAILSGVVDNIPYTATMIPVVQELGLAMPVEPLWWSLALGACLGGNLTLIGAAANVVIANLAQRNGSPISFREYVKHGALITLISMAVSSLYVWARYLLPIGAGI